MINGLIVLNEHAFELIYGSELYAELSRRVCLVAPPQTAESVNANPTLLREVDVLFSGWGAPLMDGEFFTTAPRLRALAWTLVLCAIPLAATGIKNYLSGELLQTGVPGLTRIYGYIG